MATTRAHSPVSPTTVLRRNGLRPRKSLGQTFLVNPGALRRIAAAAHLTREDVVIEVGPGTGALTRELLARASSVIAVEKDEALASALEKDFVAEPRLSIVRADALEVDPSVLLAQIGRRGEANYKVVANLPYYVATPILRRFLEASIRPSLLVVLLQREVAQSICARPGEMSLLSVAVQIYAEPRMIGVVKAGSFYPPPKVDSAIVRLDVRTEPVGVSRDETGAFFEVVKAGFSAPRKQLANPLAHGLGLSRERTLELLQEAGVDPKRRAETLSLEEWARVHKAATASRRDA
ncbi:MAG: ribosomal RNA small subunit methyltransferase A [Chloroflexi bacterium]|nr:ribosomal RNA small subunit methyltransferase A [Chloroflexota bacterium]